MACEVPVISTNVGGLPEVNIHGKTGYMANVGDVDKMSEYAISLLQQPELLQQFRAQALAQAQQFNIDNILPQYESYYEEVIKTSVHTITE